jgi:Tfp pilus assembly protein PilO
MTGRDRTVLIVVVVAAILGAAWILVVSPERQKAAQLNTKVAEAQAELTSAEDKVSSARAAQSQYASAYASLVSLGKAVPPSEEVPSLIEQLTSASDQKSVDFSSITDSSTGSSSASGASTTAAASATAAGGFTELPFTFVFEGSYFDLEHLFKQLTAFANVDASGDLQISGRLLTIQSVRLSPETSSSETHKGESELTGSVTATAYVMPATQALSGATGSAGAGTSSSPASSSAPASSATSPAIVRINP